MKLILENRKLLAREFVYFIICLIISILGFLFVFPYNYITQNQSSNFAKQVVEKNILINSIQVINNKKTEAQLYFTVNLKKEYPNYRDRTNSELWNAFYRIVEVDSVKHKWKKKWTTSLFVNFITKMGYKTPEEFTKFIKTNIINSSDIDLIEKNKKDVKFLKSQQLKKYNNFIELKEQFRISLFVLMISFFIFFILRYLIYGTKWSMKILKESQDK